MISDSERFRLNRTHLVIFAVLTLTLVFASVYYYYSSEKTSLKTEANKDLKAVADLKIDHISGWYRDELNDAETISRDIFLITVFNQWLTSRSEESKNRLNDYLEVIAKEHDYENITIASGDGNLIFGGDGNISLLSRIQREHVIKSAETGKTLSAGIYFCEIHKDIHLGFISPLKFDQPGISPVVVFEMDPDKFLYPRINTFPFESKTGETFIFKTENEHIVYLNDLRHMKDTALRLRLPVDQADLPAGKAATGYKGFVEGRDYRGVPVLAYVNSIPGTPWYMVSKVDRQEVYSGLFTKTFLLVVFASLLLLLMVAAVAILYTLRQRNMYRSMLQAEEEFRVTLYSIGDGVISTNKDGKVKYMNNVAEKLTGWKEQDARGRPLEEVFKILDEQTRSEVRNPVQKVLEKGTISGLANHTILVSRNGEEIPIADSGAPVKDTRGEIRGIVLVFIDHSAERESARKLRDSENRLNALISNLPGMVYRCKNDPDYTAEFVSEGCYEITGYPPEEFVEKKTISYANIVHDEDRQKVWDGIQNSLSEKKPFKLTYRIKTRDGNEKWVYEQGAGIYSEDGELLRLEGFITDITARINAEEENRIKQQELEEIFRVNPAIIYKLRYEDLEPVWVSDNICTILGYSKDESLTFQWWVDQIHPDDRKKTVNDLEKIYTDGHVIQEYRFRKKDGSWIWLRDEFQRVDKEGVPTIAGAWVDITDRKKIEEALRINEQRYHELFESNPFPMFVYEIETMKILEVNNSAVVHYGYSREEFLSMTLKDLHPDDQIPALIENVSNVDEGLDRAGVWTHILKDGRRISVEITSHTLIYEGRNAEVVLAYDITERRKAEQALKSSQNLLKATLDSLSEAVFLINPDNRTIELCNRAACRMFGYSSEEMTGKNTKKLHVDEKHYEDFHNMTVESLKAGKEYVGVFEMKRSNGEVFPTEHEVSNISNDFGAGSGVVSVVRDITERIKSEEEKQVLEARLRQAQKMESIGRLAGGVAHDFNNMLQAIFGYIELALMKVNKSESVYEDLLEIQKAARRSAALTRQLLAFARKQAVNVSVLDLNDTISGMLNMLRRIMGEDIELVWIPGKDLWNVKMDPDQINQILANLCANARDAIRETGRVTIETSNVTADESYRTIYPYFVPGDYVLLTVTDNGSGMEKEVLDNIFEPFYTTKELGKGTGLGLATVYGIVKQNNGYIHLYSEPDKGTTAKIYLPRESGKSPESVSAPIEETVKGTGQLILLVEDEDAILQMGKMVLEELGYRVITAKDPASALQKAEEHGSDIELVLTDVVMPEMNGKELIDKIREKIGDIRCIFMSGYTSNVIMRSLRPGEKDYFIQKPFSVNGLSGKVSEALDNRSS